MAVTVEPVFPPQVLTWEELPLLTVEAELPHWEGRRAFCRYYAAWSRGLLDYGRRVLLPQLAERCRRALEQGGMLPLTTAALRSRIVRETEHGVSICTELTGPWPYRCRGDVWADGLPVGLGECFPPHALWRALYRFYLAHMIPLIGGLVTGDRAGFEYLRDSIEAFPPQDEIADELRAAGFARVSYANLTGGIVAVYTAVR